MASNVGTVNVNLVLGRCKDCKWWDVDSLNTRTLQRICGNPKVGGPSGEGQDGAMDAYADGGIDTGPEFGCIHYEGKA